MNLNDEILRKLRMYSPGITDDSIRQLADCLSPAKFSKGECLVSEGQRCGYAYFIEKGITRSYWVVDGEEITTSFSTEGDIVFSMDAVYYGKLSEEYVEALEPLEALKINIADLRRLTDNNIEFARWWGAIHQYEYRRLHRSHKERLSLPAQERYEAFRQQFPDVCRRVYRRYIASYLGITLSTLSRISRI